MFKIVRHKEHRPSKGEVPPHDFLEAENVSLRLLLAQAEIDALGLLAQAGIDAKEREAADKLQKLILEELHHRIKNTLATVSAIASQSLRNVKGAEHAQHAIRAPNTRSTPSPQRQGDSPASSSGSSEKLSRASANASLAFRSALRTIYRAHVRPCLVLLWSSKSSELRKTRILPVLIEFRVIAFSP
jgi:HWE histidine kinase